MATLIHRSGTETPVTPINPAEGFGLQELYGILGHGCDIVQAIDLADGSIMVIDEEGKLRPTVQPINRKATVLLHEAGGMLDDYIVGPALICSHEEFK